MHRHLVAGTLTILACSCSPSSSDTAFDSQPGDAATPDAVWVDDVADSPDASPSEDTMQVDDSESSPPEDDEAAVFREWFANYNSTKGMQYLHNDGTLYEEGDTQRYPNAPPHRFLQGASYGPYSRNLLDLYIPTGSDAPVPVVIYIHGGGFTSGDKEKIHEEGKADIAGFLSSGIAVASISYRYGSKTDDLAKAAEIPNGECDGKDAGCRKDFIFRDGARSVQYLRYRAAELNLDPNRMGAWGSSAGGQIALWVGTAPDLALEDDLDPVLCESSRIQVVGHLTSQVSAKLSDWPELLGFSSAFWEGLNWSDVDYDKGLHSTFKELEETESGQTLAYVVDYFEGISADDPPMITACTVGEIAEEQMLNPENAEDAQSWFVHHPYHSTPIYEQCRTVQAECEIATKVITEGEISTVALGPKGSLEAFLIHWLKVKP